MAVLTTDQLTKVYGGKFKALDGLTLTVQAGEVFGYLGPNGAGKTTTIRMLLDFIRPTSGSAQIFGLDVHQHSIEIHRRIGFMPGELTLWSSQTANEIIRYFARVRGGVDPVYLRGLIERFEFDPSKKMRDYSTGNKRKIGLILALMHQPELLILDEPTSGLDPLMQQVFNQIMLDLRAEGKTVFLSSHVLTEVQAICDRVAIVRGGQLKAVERVETLTQADFRWVTLRFNAAAQIEAALRAIPGVDNLEITGEQVRLRLRGDFDPLLRAVMAQYVVDLRIAEPSLEEIFLEFYDDQRHGQPVNRQNYHHKVEVAS